MEKLSTKNELKRDHKTLARCTMKRLKYCAPYGIEDSVYENITVVKTTLWFRQVNFQINIFTDNSVNEHMQTFDEFQQMPGQTMYDQMQGRMHAKQEINGQMPDVRMAMLQQQMRKNRRISSQGHTIDATDDYQ